MFVHIIDHLQILPVGAKRTSIQFCFLEYFIRDDYGVLPLISNRLEHNVKLE